MSHLNPDDGRSSERKTDVLIHSFKLCITFQRSKSKSVVQTSQYSARQTTEYWKSNLLFAEAPTAFQASAV